MQPLDVHALGRAELDVDQVENVRREGAGAAGVRADGAVRAAELVDKLLREPFDGGRYVFYCVDLSDYTDNMKLRSRRWQTVNMSAEHFRQKAFPVRQLLAPETIRPYRICY